MPDETESVTDRSAEIRARLDKATPGPWDLSDGWRANVHAVVDTENVYGPEGVIAHVVRASQDGRYTDAKKANADLIAHAPADLAWLLAEHAALTQDRAQLMARWHEEGFTDGYAHAQKELATELSSLRSAASNADPHAILMALRQVKRKRVSTPRCTGCQQPWTDDHTHEDDEWVCSRQDVYHYEDDTEAQVAAIAAALAAQPPAFDAATSSSVAALTQRLAELESSPETTAREIVDGCRVKHPTPEADELGIYTGACHACIAAALRPGASSDATKSDASGLRPSGEPGARA